MIENELSKRIIGCAIEVHKQLGLGLLESAYQECFFFFFEFKKVGLKVRKEKPMPIIYKEVQLDYGSIYVDLADFLINSLNKD